MQFTEQDIETIKELLRNHGSDCPAADCAAVQALGEKLGVYEPELPPTAEELKRREEFAKSPLGIAMKEMFTVSNRYMVEIAAQELLDKQVWFSDSKNGYKWPVSLVNPDGTREAVRIKGSMSLASPKAIWSASVCQMIIR